MQDQIVLEAKNVSKTVASPEGLLTILADVSLRVRMGESLAIVRGPDAYVSPSWYAAKAEHGRVVPTWNYVTAHVYGRLVVHDDPAWVEGIVRRLTAKHEAARLASPGQAPAWSVDDGARCSFHGKTPPRRRSSRR